LRQFGVDEQVIADRERNDSVEEKPFEVWQENEPALRAFLALGTQWRIGSAGTVLGLRYEGVCAALTMMQVKDQSVMFGDLQVMETAALEVWRSQHD